MMGRQRHKGNQSVVDLEKFIEIWQSAESVSEVASETGYPINYASKKAYLLRERGIPLKKFPTYYEPKGRSWDDLAKLAKG